jgi:Protein of unknown function (DUF2500)
MSELDSFDNLFSIAFGVFLLIFLAAFVFIVGRSIKIFLRSKAIKRQNDLSPILTKQGVIISKRAEVSGGSGDSAVHTAYYVAFEFPETKERVEFRVSSNDYGLVAENDLGELTFQGTRFHKFQRTLQ